MDEFLRELLSQVILGTVQGLSEVFPISSSGHIALVTRVIPLPSGSLHVAATLHIGTFLAIVYTMRRDIQTLFLNLWEQASHWLPERYSSTRVSSTRQSLSAVPIGIGISMIPTAIIGLLLRSLAQDLFVQEKGVGLPVLFVANGLLILLFGRFSRGDRMLAELDVRDYLFIGIAQGLAVIPGISRLGLTLCAGLFRRLSWFDALRLSLLMSLVAVVGGVVLELPEIINIVFNPSFNLITISVGIGLATVFGTFAIRTLMTSVLEQRTLVYFAIYCLILGVFSLTMFCAFGGL